MQERTEDESRDIGTELTFLGCRRASDATLVAELLGGAPSQRAPRASAFLEQLGGLVAAGELGISELKATGLTPKESRRLGAALELGRRARLPVVPARPIRDPADAHLAVAMELAELPYERFVVLVLDCKSRPLHLARVAEGGVDCCSIDPRRVFAPALAARGSTVIVAHNHPSGDPTPSNEDIALTRRLCSAGKLLQLPVVDHIVVGRARGQGLGYVSLASLGQMGAQPTRRRASSGKRSPRLENR